MKIKAIAPWAGAKRLLAAQILAEIGEHNSWYEPFCGGMAMLMAKPRATMETVNDLHSDLVNLAHVVQDTNAGSALYRRLRRVLLHEQLFEESAEIIRRPFEYQRGQADVVRAYHFFVVSWLGRNGVSGTASYNCGFSRRYSQKGGHSGTRVAGAVDSIPAWRRRMRSVVILQMDGIELVENTADEFGTVIYADPPYIEKGFQYTHEFADEDHERLAIALNRFKNTRVLVSYYEHPKLAELYPPDRWTHKPLDIHRCLVNQSLRDQRDTGTKAPEVLLINGPSYTNQPSLFPAEGP